MRAKRQLALVLAVAMAPTSAFARGYGPDDAAAKRAEIEVGLSQDPRIAIQQLGGHGDELGDPELFLRAATLGRDEAMSSRDAALARTAEALARSAQDIGLYLADEKNYGATSWRPVSEQRAGQLAAEAGALADQCRGLADEIEAELAAAEAEAERARLAALEAEEARRSKAGVGLIAGGSAALVIGVGGLGMFGAGLAMGGSLQAEAEALTLPVQLPELEQLDARGATANTLGAVGGVMGAVGIGVGVALIVVGVKKRKAAGASTRAALPGVLVGGWFDDDGAGLALRGSF